MNEYLNKNILPVNGGVTFSAEEFTTQDVVGRLRCQFELESAEKLPVWIAGIAGYQLYLDDEFIHCGPEWSYDKLPVADAVTFDLSAGKHILDIWLWHHSTDASAYREMSRHAFFVLQSRIDSPAARVLNTDSGNYTACTLPGWQLVKYHMSCMAGPRLDVDFRIPAGKWQTAVRLDKEFFQRWNYTFVERELPLDYWADYHKYTLRSGDMNCCRQAEFYENIAEQTQVIANALVHSQTVQVPPHQHIRLLFDLNDYICARAAFDTEKGHSASVEIMLTESLFEHSDDWVTCYKNPIKGNRNEIDGKYAVGTGDKFTLDGSPRHCRVLDWDAGRYMVCYINTADEALTIKNFHLEQTHSGIPLTKPIEFANEKWNQVADICLNALKNCMHTTYMDCPHYEQLMYIGDGRVEALINYVTAPGCLMQRKALKMFAASVGENNLPQNRFPSRIAGFIPGFSLFFINMLHDYAMWSSDKALVSELLPGSKKILTSFEKYCNKDGLFKNPDDWNFYDWVPSWERGVPPCGDEPGALFNLHIVTVLEDLADMEEYAGDPNNVPVLRQQAERLRQAVHRQFFVAQKGIYSCDCQHKYFSQHVQAMALLAGLGDRELYEKIFDKTLELEQCTIYFSHYLFEAAKLFNDSKHPLEMMDFWKKLPEQGFFTTPERPEPSRSDCHAWGGHVLYYMVSGLAGIRPSGMGGKSFMFSPADLKHVPDFKLDLKLDSGSVKVFWQAGNLSVETAGDLVLSKQ